MGSLLAILRLFVFCIGILSTAEEPTRKLTMLWFYFRVPIYLEGVECIVVPIVYIFIVIIRIISLSRYM